MAVSNSITRASSPFGGSSMTPSCRVSSMPPPEPAPRVPLRAKSVSPALGTNSITPSSSSPAGDASRASSLKPPNSFTWPACICAHGLARESATSAASKLRLAHGVP